VALTVAALSATIDDTSAVLLLELATFNRDRKAVNSVMAWMNRGEQR
jgi:hypothetical protein